MNDDKIKELSELFGVATITTVRPNEHLPYTTITLAFMDDGNAKLCLDLITELADEQGIVRN